MNVKQLREALEGIPDDVQVIMSSDEEGNSIKSLYEVDHSIAMKDGSRYYDLIDAADKDEYEASDLISVIVLWP